MEDIPRPTLARLVYSGTSPPQRSVTVCNNRASTLDQLILLKLWATDSTNTAREMESRAMPKYEPSPFSDPVAVDAWDSWFRWRDGNRLYDLSIETTWLRVARALAGVEN